MSFDVPSPDWTQLVTAVVSAAVGWLLHWIGVWQAPKPPSSSKGGPT